MNLYLVQHAEAKPESEDPERSLTEKGWRDIRKVSGFAPKQAGVQVSRILHSGKTRARQTAEALAEHLKPSEGVHATDGVDPLADPSIWANRLAEVQQDLMIVGHLPHLSKLAALLLVGSDAKEVVKFEQGGIVCLSKDDSGSWAVRWMVIPRIVA